MLIWVNGCASVDFFDHSRQCCCQASNPAFRGRQKHCLSQAARLQDCEKGETDRRYHSPRIASSGRPPIDRQNRTTMAQQLRTDDNASKLTIIKVCLRERETSYSLRTIQIQSIYSSHGCYY